MAMKRNSFAPALFAAVLLAMSPALALAQAAPKAQPEQEIGTRPASKAELDAFAKAKISVAEAIAAAANHVKGGTVFEATFDAVGGPPAYKVKAYQNNAVWEGVVDAQTGAVIGNGTTTPESQLDAEDQAEIAGLKRAATSLPQAVAIAEKRAAGKAMAAGLEETAGKIVYEIVLVKNGATRKVVVDPMNGTVIKG
jgi:uncharacterized membrane protein YkoI